MKDKTPKFTVSEITPDSKEILAAQGVKDIGAVKERVLAALSSAEDIFRNTAKPKALIKSISVEVFAPIFEGEGKSYEEFPLKNMWSHADALAIYSITIGAKTSEEIERLMAANDFAVASFLDTAASLATERVVTLCEREFMKEIDSPLSVLSYSPGYCGWHITSQKRLFEFIEPEQIGIELSDVCLMSPIKSTTGVHVVGPKKLHKFINNYSFCKHCEASSCRDRIKSL